MSNSNPKSYPVLKDTYLGTTGAARISQGGDPSREAALTFQVLRDDRSENEVQAVMLYVDTCPEDGERSVLRVRLTRAEAKHLRKVLKNALTA